MTQRIQRHPFLAIFDGADPSASTAARSSTTTPLQALYLLNDPFIHEQSERIAKQFTEVASDEELVQSTFERLFARQPDSVEVQSSLQYLGNIRRQMTAPDGSSNERDAIASWVRALLRLNEFVYID